MNGSELRRDGLAAVAGVLAASAWYGAAGLITGFLNAPADLVRRLPFGSPVFGGVALAVVVAAPTTVTAVYAWGRRRIARQLAVVSGALLVGWIAVEFAVVQQFSPLQPICAIAGLLLLLLARQRPGPSPDTPRTPLASDAIGAGAPSVKDAIDLYWLPLGAGGRCVRANGAIYEAFVARRSHRAPRDLYHSALEIHLDGVRWVIEMAPVWNEPSPERGVVQEGAVGSPVLGTLRAFRYEVRRWPNGHIPDVAEAVDSPIRLSTDRAQAATVLAAAPLVPALVWGRDELGCGEMWNSNSLIAWLLSVSGHDMDVITAPAGGRAPGWHAGLTLAARRARPVVTASEAGFCSIR